MLWMDFVNSLAHDPLGRGTPREQLQEAAWRCGFAQRAGLPLLARLRPADLRRLQQLRTLLQQMAQGLAQAHPPSHEQLEQLNRELHSIPVRGTLRRQGKSFQRTWTPAVGGIEAWVFAIADSFAEFLVAADLQRLRICGNADCGWVFYDSTRSRTRRWCADSCGDLIKVREFRARQKRQAVRR